MKAGSPRQGGAGGLKIASAGFQLANVEAGSWRRGGWQAVFAHSTGLCFPWVPGVSHPGASEEVLASQPPTLPHTGWSAGFISGFCRMCIPLPGLQGCLKNWAGVWGPCDRGEEMCHSDSKDLGLNLSRMAAGSRLQRALTKSWFSSLSSGDFLTCVCEVVDSKVPYRCYLPP